MYQHLLKFIHLFIVLTFSLNALAYTADWVGPNKSNTRILNKIEKDKWVRIKDYGYIPYIDVKKFQYEYFIDKSVDWIALNTAPYLSVFLNTTTKKYQHKEIHDFLFGNERIILEVTTNKEGEKLLSTDKYKNIEDALSWIYPDSKSYQKVSKIMTEKYIGMNFQGFEPYFLHWGKITLPTKEQYCTVFYFWTEKNQGLYKTRVNGVWCKKGKSLFNSFADLSLLIKNIEYRNEDKLRVMYVDMKTQAQSKKAIKEKVDKDKAKADKAKADKAKADKAKADKAKADKAKADKAKADKAKADKAKADKAKADKAKADKAKADKEKKSLQDFMEQLEDENKAMEEQLKQLQKQTKERDEKDQSENEEIKKEIIQESKQLLEKQNTGILLLNDLINKMQEEIKIIQRQKITTDTLIVMQNDRGGKEQEYDFMLTSFNKDYDKIQNYKKMYPKSEINLILIEFKTLKEKFNNLSSVFSMTNGELTELIRQKIDSQKTSDRDPLVYILVILNFVFIVIVIFGFYMFFKRSRIKKDSVRENDKDISQPKKETFKLKTDANTDEKKSITDNIDKKIEDKQVKEKTPTSKTMVKEDVVDEEDQNEEKVDDPKDVKMNFLEKYLESFTNPNTLGVFKNEWNVLPLDRVSSLSQKDHVELETSKKILEKSNFWLIKNHKDDSLFYVLPGKTLWMRIHDILQDKSRFGYMNFNGIYQLSSGKSLEIKTPCSAIKDENGRFVVTAIGSIVIPKKV